MRTIGSIESIAELDPGQITGPLSAIFRGVINRAADQFGYDPTTMIAPAVGSLSLIELSGLV